MFWAGAGQMSITWLVLRDGCAAALWLWAGPSLPSASSAPNTPQEMAALLWSQAGRAGRVHLEEKRLWGDFGVLFRG